MSKFKVGDRAIFNQNYGIRATKGDVGTIISSQVNDMQEAVIIKLDNNEESVYVFSHRLDLVLTKVAELEARVAELEREVAELKPVPEVVLPKPTRSIISYQRFDDWPGSRSAAVRTGENSWQVTGEEKFYRDKDILAKKDIQELYVPES